MPHDEAKRRDYWAAQLDAAYAFMMRVMDYPVEECGERLVSLPDAASEAGVEVLFSDRTHFDGSPRVYVLREGQIAGFIGAARRLNRSGWAMRVEDGYRSREVQKGIGLQPHVFDAVLRSVVWELGGRTPDADFLFRRLMTLVAQAPKIGTHMSGSAVDISVLDRNTGEEVDRGGPYLEMSERTPMDSPFLSRTAMENRREITAILRENGFAEYPYEFWHYNSGDAYEQCLRETGRPARYGPVDLDPATGRVLAMEEACDYLNSREEIEAEILESLARLGER